MAEKYKLLPEHEARFPEWRDKWIANAMRSTPLTDAEHDEIGNAIKMIYKVSDLPEPKVIWVPSPVSGAIASTLAGGIIAARKENKFKEEDILAAARSAAIHLVAKGAERLYGKKPTGSVPAKKVVLKAMYEAIGIENPERAVLPLSHPCTKFMLECASRWHSLYHGGNQWSGWSSYISFFRHVAKLDLDYSKWHWVEIATTAGPRFMHDDFCMVSDLPTRLTLDDGKLPHHPTQGYCEWTDGWELGYWHGVAVPLYWIKEKDKVDPKLALTWENVEQRRALAEILGWTRVLEMLDVKVIDKDPDPQIGTLLEVDLPESPKSRFLQVRCGTGRDFCLCVPATMKTALQANAWTYSIDDDLKNFKPEVRT